MSQGTQPGEAFTDKSGMLRSDGLIDLIERFASGPRSDLGEGPKVRTVAVQAKPEAAVICTYKDGTPQSFKVGMRMSRNGEPISNRNPTTIEINRGDPIGLTARQSRDLGHLLQMSLGRQPGLRDHINSFMAKHPHLTLLGLGVANGAIVETGCLIEGVPLPATAIAGGIGVFIAQGLAIARERLEKGSQRESLESEPKHATRKGRHT
jgi:hypothetical protein